MMETIQGLDAVRKFVERNAEQGIETTGASVVSCSAGLYNVCGSTDDPPHVPGHENATWKGLLQAYKIDGQCYVTNPGAEGTHPQFLVGGHMTTDAKGVVAPKGSCYLMPLCKWHNSTSKDGILFDHTETAMLQLTGYMVGELAVTFRLRMPNAAPYALLYYANGAWDYQDLSAGAAAEVKAGRLPATLPGEVNHYVLIERIRTDQTLHYIRTVHLPGV